MKKIILLFAFVNVIFGWILQQYPAALPFDRATDGSLLYPISSGSEDAHLLAFALQGFVFTLFMSLFPRAWQMAAYVLNLLLLWLVCGLIALDSSLWAAAQVGFALPLLAVAWANLPLLLIVKKMFQAA